MGGAWDLLSDNLRAAIDEVCGMALGDAPRITSASKVLDSNSAGDRPLVLFAYEQRYAAEFRNSISTLRGVAGVWGVECSLGLLRTAAVSKSGRDLLSKDCLFIVSSLDPDVVRESMLGLQELGLDAVPLPLAVRHFDLLNAMDDKGWLQYADPTHFRTLRDGIKSLSIVEKGRSVKTLEALMWLRLDFDPATIEPIVLPESEQYIHRDGYPPLPGDVIVDGGAFDGDTALRFAGYLSGDIGALHCFEPDPSNYLKLEARLGSLSKYKLYQAALAAAPGLRSFDARSSPGSRLASSGNSQVNVLSLDTTLSSPVKFIKLDVEGLELEALQGAQAILTRHRPRLAVSCYHHPIDLVSIPLWVQELDLGYRARLLHFSPYLHESVWSFACD